MERKKINIQKPHFRFSYALLDKEPWVVQDGRDIIAFIPQGKFVEYIQQEGKEAKATAISIAKKTAPIAVHSQKQMQRELIPKA